MQTTILTLNLARYSTYSVEMRHRPNGEVLGLFPTQTGKEWGSFSRVYQQSVGELITMIRFCTDRQQRIYHTGVGIASNFIEKSHNVKLCAEVLADIDNFPLQHRMRLDLLNQIFGVGEQFRLKFATTVYQSQKLPFMLCER